MFQYTASVDFSTPLVHLILRQFHTYPVEVLSAQIETRHAILTAHCQSIIDSRDASTPSLSLSLYRSITILLGCSTSSVLDTVKPEYSTLQCNYLLKRVFDVADNSIYIILWPLSAQGCFSGLLVLEIWMVITSVAFRLCVWKTVQLKMLLTV